MGNITFIVPTQNLEYFNIDKIKELLKEEFKNLDIKQEKEWDHIRVMKGDLLVTVMYFNQECYILNFEDDISCIKEELKHLAEEKRKHLITKLEELRDLNPDLNNCIQMTYGKGSFETFEFKNDVEFFLQKYFQSYIFDEGIHPEFIDPTYERNSKKSLISKIAKLFLF